MTEPVGINEFLETARQGLDRVESADLPRLQAEGAYVVDIRPDRNRSAEGEVPGAVVIDRLVLEWRLDRSSGHARPDAPEHDDLVVVMCNEGYASSLAARDLQLLGFHRATDLIGGFREYAARGLPVVPWRDS